MSDSVNNLSIIVFSKDRPLQLQGYIASLLYFSKLDPSLITVFYKDSPDFSYQKVINEFPTVNWVSEKAFFNDLLAVINNANKYIMFGCDDVVFKDHIDIPFALNFLANNNNVFGFSLRLGENIRLMPQDVKKYDKHITWNWKDTDANSWNYPWELVATIYRKSEVVNIVSKFKPGSANNPNFFEFVVATQPELFISQNELAAFKKGKCIVLTINRVQDDVLNDFDDTCSTDIEELYKLYNDGYTIDYIAISRKKHNHIHVGPEYLKLKGGKGNRKAIELYFQVYKSKISGVFKKVLRKIKSVKKD